MTAAGLHLTAYIVLTIGGNEMASDADADAHLCVCVWQLGDNPTKEDVKAFTEKTLSSGKVVPGFGHAVLRVSDPR